MSDVFALLLADGRTPGGAHAHSGGLEPALAAGLSPAEIPGLIAGRLRTVGYLDAAFAAAAARAEDPQLLGTLESEWLARTPAPALRESARRLGRALLRTASSLRLSSAALEAWAASSAATPRCVALGAIAGAAGLTPRRAATVALYDDAATVAGAAPKLVSVDSAAAVGWVAGCAGLIAALATEAAEAAEARSPAALPAIATPGLEAFAEDHRRRQGRLFAS